MATLPPWLVDFSPIRESVTNAKRIGGTDFQSVLARMEMAQRGAAQADNVALRRQAMAQEAAQDAARLELSAQQAAAQGARDDRRLGMSQAQLDMEIQRDRDRAIMESRKFQAVTGYQSCVQNGGDPRTCALKHLPETVLSHPSSFFSQVPDPNDKRIGTLLDLPNGGKAMWTGPKSVQFVDKGTQTVSPLETARINKLIAETETIKAKAETVMDAGLKQQLSFQSKVILDGYGTEEEKLARIGQLYESFAGEADRNAELNPQSAGGRIEVSNEADFRKIAKGTKIVYVYPDGTRKFLTR